MWELCAPRAPLGLSRRRLAAHDGRAPRVAKTAWARPAGAAAEGELRRGAHAAALLGGARGGARLATAQATSQQGPRVQQRCGVAVKQQSYCQQMHIDAIFTPMAVARGARAKGGWLAGAIAGGSSAGAGLPARVQAARRAKTGFKACAHVRQPAAQGSPKTSQTQAGDPGGGGTRKNPNVTGSRGCAGAAARGQVSSNLPAPPSGGPPLFPPPEGRAAARDHSGLAAARGCAGAGRFGGFAARRAGQVRGLVDTGKSKGRGWVGGWGMGGRVRVWLNGWTRHAVAAGRARAPACRRAGRRAGVPWRWPAASAAPRATARRGAARRGCGPGAFTTSRLGTWSSRGCRQLGGGPWGSSGEWHKARCDP
jgi:hypothetical protein